MSSILGDFKNVFRRKDNTLVQIILINVVIFIVVNIILAFIQFSSDNYIAFGNKKFDLLRWLALPADLSRLLFRFWTIITYMFLHIGFWHILFNMLWLYWLGKIFMEYQGGKKFVATYFMGGISGGLLFIILYNLVPGPFFETRAILFGASASVLAIVFATAALLPDYTIGLLFIGAVRLKYIALAALVFTTILDFAENTGGKIAHLGGALYGYLYVVQLKKGNDWATGFYKVVNSLGSIFKRSPRKRMKVTYKRRKKSEKTNAKKAYDQKKIDAILDKISQSGYDSLTKEEKEILFRMSNKK